MGGEVLRIGAVARLDPEPEAELQTWRVDLGRGLIDDPEETRQRIAEYERGQWVIVVLALFADVLDSGELKRLDGAEVSGCWFSASQHAQNLRYAREMAGDKVSEVRELLEARDVTVGLDELESMPLHVELDAAVEGMLERSQDDRREHAADV